MGKTVKKNSKWISKAVEHKGALRKALGVKQGEDIPQSKLKKAAKSKNPIMRKRAILAETLESFHKKKKS